LSAGRCPRSESGDLFEGDPHEEGREKENECMPSLVKKRRKKMRKKKHRKMLKKTRWQRRQQGK
jgi:hypothetical protein